MLSFGLPSTHYYPQPGNRPQYVRPRSLNVSSMKKSREILIGKSLLQSNLSESWRQPRWPAKSLEDEEERYNQFRGPRTRATKKKRVSNSTMMTATESWHPKALVWQVGVALQVS